MAPMEDRDWYRGEHPPSCTCVECTNKRLGLTQRGSGPKRSGPAEVSACPMCGRTSLFYNSRDDIYECLNPNCKARGHSPEEIRQADIIHKKSQTANPVSSQTDPVPVSGHPSATPPPFHPVTGTIEGRSGRSFLRTRSSVETIPDWLKALLLVFGLSMVGLATGTIVGGTYLFWVLLAFGGIFSCEKWFGHVTNKHRSVGKLYRLFLNLAILSALGLLIWSAVRLFSQRFAANPLAGTAVFLAELVFFIWLWRVVSKNSWRWPSMKLTVFCLAVVFVVSGFAGVQPVATYKDQVVDAINSGRSGQTSLPGSPTTLPNPATIAPRPLTPSPVAPPPTTAARPPVDAIDSKTGKYKSFFLGLARTPGGPLGGSNCYGEFIVLINNSNAVNPTYSQLVSFLQQDKTDLFPYTYSLSALGMYYGTAESHVDLQRVKNIINGIESPKKPQICADFAERLHNNAEAAGIRCGYVSIDLSGYTDPYKYGIASNSGHALNVFQTTDKGLVYVDVTNSPGPSRCVKIVDLRQGAEYVPQSLFPEPGWSTTWDSMGTVTGIQEIWDGNWND
jgi:hypothetical protein